MVLENFNPLTNQQNLGKVKRFYKYLQNKCFVLIVTLNTIYYVFSRKFSLLQQKAWGLGSLLSLNHYTTSYCPNSNRVCWNKHNSQYKYNTCWPGKFEVKAVLSPDEEASAVIPTPPPLVSAINSFINCARVS